MDIRFVVYVAQTYWVLLIPCLIVALWRARPKAAMFTAVLVLFFSLLFLQLYWGYQAFELFGYSERRMELFIEDMILFCILGMIMFTPVLVLLRHLLHRAFRAKKDERDIFR